MILYQDNENCGKFQKKMSPMFGRQHPPECSGSCLFCRRNSGNRCSQHV